MAFHQGRKSRKKEDLPVGVSHVPCSAQTLPATLPMARAKASTGSNPTALTGANQLSTLQNRASPFQSNIKCVFCHCQHPGVILHASDPSSYLQTPALCWQTPSCKALQCQERQWFHSTGPKPSVSEVYERAATGHVEGHSDFLYVRPVFSRSELVMNLFFKKIMLSLFSFTVGMKDILVFIKCFD